MAQDCWRSNSSDHSSTWSGDPWCQAAWLLRAVTCIDLTTLAGDDTETNVARLCLKAARPVRKDLLQVIKIIKKKL